MRLSSLLGWRKPVVVEEKEPEIVYPKGWNARLGGYYQTEEDRRREKEEEEEYLRNGSPDGTFKFHTEWYYTRSYAIEDRFNAPTWDPYENDVLLVRPEPPPPKPPFKRYFVLAFLVWAFMHWLYARHLRKKAAQQRDLEFRRAHGIPDRDTRDWDIAYPASIRRRRYYENKWRVKTGLFPLADDKNGQTYLLKKWGPRFTPIPPPRPWEEVEAEKIRLWRLERRREWKQQQIASGKACMPPGGLDTSDEEAWDDEFDGVYLRQLEDPNDPRRFSPSFQARMLDPIDRDGQSPTPSNNQREPSLVPYGPSPAKQFPGEYPPTPMSPFMELMLNAPPVPDWDMSRPWQYCPPYVYQAPPNKKLTGLQLVLTPMVPVGLPVQSPAPSERPKNSRSMSVASSVRSSKKRPAPDEPTDSEARAAKRQRTGTPVSGVAGPSNQTPPPATSTDAPRGVKRSRSHESGDEDGPRKRSKTGDNEAPNPDPAADPTAEQAPPVPEEEVEPDLAAEWRAMMEVFMEEGRKKAPYKEMQWGPPLPIQKRKKIPAIAKGNPSAEAASSGGKRKTTPPKKSSKQTSGPGPVRQSKRPTSEEQPKEKKPPKIIKRTTQLITTQRGTPVLSVEMMLTETGETLMEFSPPSTDQAFRQPTPPIAPTPAPVERAPTPTAPPPKPTPNPPRLQMTLPLQAPVPRIAKALPPTPPAPQTPLSASQLILKGAPKTGPKKPRVPPHLVMYRASQHGNKPLKPSPLSSKPPITAPRSDDESSAQDVTNLTVAAQFPSTSVNQATVSAFPSYSLANTITADLEMLSTTAAAIPSTSGSGLPFDGTVSAVESSQYVQQPSVSVTGPASGSSAPSESSPSEDVMMDQVTESVQEESGEAMISLYDLPPYIPSRAIREADEEADRRAARRLIPGPDLFALAMDPSSNYLDSLMELTDSASVPSSSNTDPTTSPSGPFDPWTTYPFAE